MKTKKLLAMLLLVLMMAATVGTMAGCGGKDDRDDKQVETLDKDEDKEEPKATATPDPTATPTPEVLPTVEELFDANKDMFEENMKMTTTFAYNTSTEYGEMAMDMDVVLLRNDGISYEYGEVMVSMLGVTESLKSEAYYVDDEDSAMRTEYSFDSENSIWVKSEYAYIATEDDLQDFPYESLTDAEVTQDDAFYYVTGVVEDVESLGDVDSLGVDGLEMSNVSCVFKFDKKTKSVVSVEFVYKFDMDGVDGESMSVDDLLILIETCEEPIVIPEEALAAELRTDTESDWEDILGEDIVLPEPEKYAESEMPEGWGTWYDEYNCKSGTFLVWAKETWENIPVTVYAKENWYFDNQYNYMLYLAVNDPEISEDSPAYEVCYEDSEVWVTDAETAPETLVTMDYNEVTAVEDVVPVVVDGRQCFYLENTAYEYVRSFVVFQDVGLDSYIMISISTGDLTSNPIDIVQKFMLSIEEE